jgi:hypothetical protein
MNPRLGHFYMEEAGGEGGGGPSAAPAPTGAPAPSAPPAADPPAVNWDEMVTDAVVVDDPPGAGEPPEGEVVKPPEGTPPEGQQPPTQPPGTPPQQPPAQPPAQPQKTPEQLQEEAKAHREGLLTQWSGIYETELTEDDKSALMTAPETVIPRLMAKAAMDAVDFARREFQAALPRYVAQHMNSTQQATGAWKAFTDAHKDLAKPEYRKVIAQAAQTVKATQPDLPAEEAMAMVAETARTLLRLPKPGVTPAPEGQPAAPVAPHNPVARGRASPRPPAAVAKKDAPNSSEIDWGDLAGAS